MEWITDPLIPLHLFSATAFASFRQWSHTSMPPEQAILLQPYFLRMLTSHYYVTTLPSLPIPLKRQSLIKLQKKNFTVGTCRSKETTVGHFKWSTLLVALAVNQTLIFQLYYFQILHFYLCMHVNFFIVYTSLFCALLAVCLMARKRYLICACKNN